MLVTCCFAGYGLFEKYAKLWHCAVIAALSEDCFSWHGHLSNCEYMFHVFESFLYLNIPKDS